MELEKTEGWSRYDTDAHLAASLLVATWSVAFVQAHEVYRRTKDGAAAARMFLLVVDRGSAGIETAISKTPFANVSGV